MNFSEGEEILKETTSINTNEKIMADQIALNLFYFNRLFSIYN